MARAAKASSVRTVSRNSGRKAAPPPAPMKRTSSAPTKEELKAQVQALTAQVEKLEASNKRLRAKQRDASRVGKDASARIAELEDELEQLRKASPPPRQRRRRPRELDPGDSVPEGVAVLEPQPLDQEAEEALENLDAHLHAEPGSGGGR